MAKTDALVAHYIEAGALRLDEDGNLISPDSLDFRRRPVGNYEYMYLPATDTLPADVVHVARIICWIAHGPPPGSIYYADHINRNKLDNQPGNLRWVTPLQNARNRADCKRPTRG